MGDKGEKKLNGAQQKFVVQCLARFMSPTDTAKAVNEHFEIEITRQAVEKYDPTKAAGSDLKDEFRALFTKTRDEYIAATNNAALAHKPYRLEVLLRLIEKAEGMKNLSLAGQLVKQAKEEVEAITSGDPDPNSKANIPPQANLTVTIKNESGASLQARSGTPKPGD